ncbi:hypothetical protein [Sphingomonas sanxanigenens]|nr:hypothetical protein [Sphingomonas sanxanigenens]
MSMMIVILAAALTQPEPHRITVDHGGKALEVVYRGEVTTRTRPVGSAPPTRSGHVRCDWTATVRVHRQLAGDGAAAAHPVAGERRIKGSRAGDCITNRAAIRRDIAARSAEVQTHVAALAAEDRPALMAALTAGGQREVH